MAEFRPLEKESSTDSGVSSNNQSDEISSTNSTIHNQQSHHVMYGHEGTRTIQKQNHIGISQDSTSFVNNEIIPEFEEDRCNQILSSDVSNQGNTTNGNCTTGIQRSPSDVTTTISICYTNVTLKSSRVSSSITSSITGLFSKPSNRSSIQDLFQAVPLQRQTDNISLHGENNREDKQIDNIPLHRENDYHDKREYVRDWLRKSTEDLPQIDSLNGLSTENSSTIMPTSGIQEYVQVENGGSLKSHSTGYSKYTPSENSEKCEVMHRSSKTQNESPIQNTVIKALNMPSDTNKENKEEDNVHIYTNTMMITSFKRRSYKSNEKNNVNDIVTVQTLTVDDHSTVHSSPANENKENSSSNLHTISIDTSALSHTNNLVQIHKTCETQDKLDSQPGRTIQACVVDGKDTDNLSSAISDYLLVDECDSHSS